MEVNAKVIHTGKTSIHLMLNVKSKKPKGGNYKVNTHCLMVFVAVDAYGNKTAVPKWNPVTSQEIAAEKFALNYIKLRQKAESNIADFTVFP